MIALSINICGTGCDKKRNTLRSVLDKYRVNFLSIQETFMQSSDLFRVKMLWGNYGFDFAESLSRGHSGGLLSIWDPAEFCKESMFVFESFIVVKGKWIAENLVVYMVNVYAPQSESGKCVLWQDILQFMDMHPGEYVIHGDFNSVRNREERQGTNYLRANAVNFNEFINQGQLFDMPMGRHKFSRLSADGSKASRLDRFLISHSLILKWPDLGMDALDNMISDHRPILLSQKRLDFGPRPFKFF